MFIDTHCHLQDEKLMCRIDEIITDAINAGVEMIVVNGCDKKSNIDAIDLSSNYENLYAAIGYHPEDSDIFDMEFMKNNIQSKKVVAIGEIGLDYYYGHNNESVQKEKFIAQLELAIKYDLPVIIHNRNATDDMYHILKEYSGKLRGIIHCFSGSVETAKMFINLGFLLGIGGIVTFKNNDNIREVLKQITIDNLVLETDAPYLTPYPYRKYCNEPKYVVVTAETLSQIYGMSIDEIGRITSANAKKLFKIV